MEVLNRPEPGIEVKPYIDPDRPEGMEARKRIARLFSAALLILGRSVAKQVARRFRELGKADDPTVEDLMRMLSIEFDDDLEDDLVDELGRIYSSSGQAALSQVGVATADQLTNRVNEGAIAWAERHVGDLIGLNPDTESWVSMATRNMIRGTIVDAMRDNLSSEDIAAKLEQEYAFSEERAELIAMTEVASANSMGALEGYQAAEDAGVRVGKSWLILEDACGICHSNADEGIIPLDQEFGSGDLTPPGHPNCRCVIVPHPGFEKMEKGWEDQPRFPAGTPTGGQWTRVGYRGTPVPESHPEARDFPGVYMADSVDIAKQYGEHVSRYRVRGGRQFLNMEDLGPHSAARMHITAYSLGVLGEDIAGNEDAIRELAAELHLMPQNYPGWVERLDQYELGGTRFAQETFVRDPSTLSIQYPPARKFTKAVWDESKHPRHPAGSSQGGEFSGQTNDAHAAIKQEVESWALLGVNHPGKKWLLENGEECGPVIPLPDGMKLGTQKMCYMNSYQALLHGAVDQDEWFYTEGVTTLPGLPITIDHAWLTNRKGEVLDLTLRDNTGHSYFGIPLKYDYVAKRALKTKHYGVFSNGVHWYPEVVDEPPGHNRAWPKKAS